MSTRSTGRINHKPQPRINGIQPDGVRLGEVIRTARETVGLSIRNVAAACGVHHSFISRLESGDYQSAKPRVLARIARTLEIDERDLFALGGMDPPEGLPAFAPYLRAKYDMSDEAARALADYFGYAQDRYGIEEKRPPAA